MTATRLTLRTLAFLAFFTTGFGGGSQAATYDGGQVYVVSNDLAAANLILGDEQSGNELIITNGAVFSISKTVNVGQSQSSVSNRLAVAPGSALSAGSVGTETVAAVGTNGIFIGDGGVFNAANASRINAEYLYVSPGSNDTAAAVVLSGTGTVLNVERDAFIGYAGSGGRVEIQNGAMLSADTLTVGTPDNSNNVVSVSAGGILAGSSDTSFYVTNSVSLTNDLNAVDILSGGILRIIGDARYDTITNRGVSIFSGAVLEVGGTLTDADNILDEGITYRLDNSISTNTAVWDTGADGQMYIGYAQDGNRLEITGAAEQTAGTVFLGFTASSGQNVLSVDGAGSRLTVSNSVTVGLAGDGNAFLVEDGATAEIGGNLRIGQNSGAENNRAAVSGTGSVLEVSGNILVGNFGSGSSLTVSDAGAVDVLGNLTAGVEAGSGNNRISVLTNGTLEVAEVLTVGLNGNGNSAVVRGTNAVLTVQSNAVIGAGGSANTLTVSDQGLMEVGSDLMAGSGKGSNNTITVSGSNTFLQVTGGVRLGDGSSGNRMAVTNQAHASAAELYVGAGPAVSNNTVVVTGTGSLFRVAGDIHLGATNAAGNTVDVRNGGTLFMGGTVIAGSGSNNVIAVNSGGTLNVTDWNFTTEITGLVFNAGATLGVGGTLTATNSVVDRGRFTLVLDGAIATNQAVWDAGTNTLTVGSATGTNTLAARDGGRIVSSNLVLGAASSSSGNQLRVQGTNAQLAVAADLTIGAGGSSRNGFTVGTNGSAAVGRDLIAGDASGNNQIQVGDDGATNSWGVSQLTVSNNLLVGRSGGTGNSLTLHADGQVLVLNELQIGQGAGGNQVTVDGSNAVLTVDGDVTVGDEDASGNLLQILEGTVDAGAGLIVGSASNSINNRILVEGSNAALRVAGDWIVGDFGGGNTAAIRTGAVVNAAGNVFIGRNSGDNRMEVLGGAGLKVGGDLRLAGTGSRLQIDSLSSVTVSGNYHQASGTTLQIGINTNQASLSVEEIADFEGGSRIFVDTTGFAGEASTNIQAVLVRAGTLQINGAAAATSGLGALDVEFANTLTVFNAYLTNQTIVVDGFTELPITDTLELDGSAAIAGNIVDRLADEGNTVAVGQRAILDGLSKAQAAQAMKDNYGSQESASPIHTLVNAGVAGFAEQMAGRQTDVRSRMGMEGAGYAMIGAEPDTNAYQQLQGWVRGFGSLAARDAQDAFYGYDASTYGTAAGFDLIVRDRLLFGVAGGYGTSDVEKDNGATGDAVSRFAAFYASVAGDQWFADGGLIYADSSVDQDLGDVFGTTAAYDARNIAAHFMVGRETAGRYLIVTPQAGLLVNYYDQDAYTEESSAALPRTVDAFDQLYLQSSLGGKIGMYALLGEIPLRTELRLHWLHEFNAEEEDVIASIGGDPQQLTLTMQAPEKDVFRIGAGAAVQLSEYLEFRIDVNAAGSGDYSQYDCSGTLRYQF